MTEEKTTIEEGTLNSDSIIELLRKRLSEVNSMVDQQEVSVVTEVADR